MILISYMNIDAQIPVPSLCLCQQDVHMFSFNIPPRLCQIGSSHLSWLCGRRCRSALNQLTGGCDRCEKWQWRCDGMVLQLNVNADSLQRTDVGRNSRERRQAQSSTALLFEHHMHHHYSFTTVKTQTPGYQVLKAECEIAFATLECIWSLIVSY